jgi:hypothetical protein
MQIKVRPLSFFFVGGTQEDERPMPVLEMMRWQQCLRQREKELNGVFLN